MCSHFSFGKWMKKIVKTNQGQNMIHFLVLGGYLILLITAGSLLSSKIQESLISIKELWIPIISFENSTSKNHMGFMKNPAFSWMNILIFQKKLKTIITNSKTRYMISFRISVTLRTSLIFDRQFGVVFNTQPKLRVHFKGTAIV